MYGGRLQKHGKSMRSEVPPDGHRSDSSGMPDAFPIQRSSDSGLVTLRLSHPPGLQNAEIFSCFYRCPPYTHPTCPWLLSGLRNRVVVSFFRFSFYGHSFCSISHIILSKVSFRETPGLHPSSCSFFVSTLHSCRFFRIFAASRRYSESSCIS